MPSAEPSAALAEERQVTLIARAASGDQAALAALYDETSARVFGFALRIVRDRAAAEEITLDVYGQVYRQASRYDATRGTPLAWLLTITRSRSLSWLRVAARRRQHEAPLEEGGALASADSDPAASSLEAEMRHVVQTALSSLTPEQRHVIELAYYAGLSQSEIATRTHQPLGTVKTRIRRAMMALRDHLGAADRGLRE